MSALCPGGADCPTQPSSAVGTQVVAGRSDLDRGRTGRAIAPLQWHLDQPVRRGCGAIGSGSHVIVNPWQMLGWAPTLGTIDDMAIHKPEAILQPHERSS